MYFWFYSYIYDPIYCCRILELGFGKEIEEILQLLGSKKSESDSEGNDSSNSKRQNLLLSATLNEKVNHLAKISLENPVMIGLDDKKMQQHALFNQNGSDSDDDLELPIKTTYSSSADYKLPAQLNQRYVKGIS